MRRLEINVTFWLINFRPPIDQEEKTYLRNLYKVGQKVKTLRDMKDEHAKEKPSNR